MWREVKCQDGWKPKPWHLAAFRIEKGGASVGGTDVERFNTAETLADLPKSCSPGNKQQNVNMVAF